jgi:hypothetical protein
MTCFNRPIRLACAVAVALPSGLVWSAGCLNTDPLLELPAEDAAAPTVDVLTDAGADVDLRGPCQRCVEAPDDAAGGGCASILTNCNASPKCAGTYQCVLRAGCLTKGVYRDIINCGIPCAEEAGIVTQTDPAIPLVLGVTNCVSTGPCGKVCADAGS